MKVWIPNNKNRLKKTLLGSVPTPAVLKKILKKPVPKSIQKVLEETLEDLHEIRKVYEQLGVEVLSYPVETIEDSINVRNGFIVVDDHLYITERLDYLSEFYKTIEDKTFLQHSGGYPGYCPDIFVHDDYAILDCLEPEAYQYWRGLLSENRKIITAFNQEHSDGIYCNVADKIWLTNGDVLPYKKYWPDIPVMELSDTNSGKVNSWKDATQFYKLKQQLYKTNGKFIIAKHDLSKADIDFIEHYLDKWIGYCEETLFDINLSVIDKENIIAISQNSLVYDKLESLDVKIHKVPFRHRFFWDGGIHCITNDLVREKIN